ncbi:MAG: iron ABC transporter permease [Alphaproteobacteria bacterium GM202ARS2]|nr:iron ABC transporter permease [Alphaproteobacteria bacterium GM202ARS2]
MKTFWQHYGLRGIILFCAVLVGMPLVMMIGSVVATSPQDDEVWAHILAHALGDYMVTTLALAAGVGSLSAVMGVACAWLVSMYRFWGSSFFKVALLLPMAMPAYIVAFVYTDMLDHGGRVATWLNDSTGADAGAEVWFDVRTLPMAILVMALTLYPYVFALVRASLVEQSFCVWQAGRTLGCGAWRNFWLVGLPLLRPALVVAVVIVIMETLNDFGVVSAFSLPTLTSGIYHAWLNMNSLSVAVRLALLLLVLVLLILLVERWARGNRRYHAPSGSHRQMVAEHLKGARAVVSFCFCASLVVFGFVLPFVVLLWLAAHNQHQAFAEGFVGYGLNSLALSGSAAMGAVALGFMLAWAARPPSGWLFRSLMRLASIGYAIPGAVLAIALLLWLSAVDKAQNAGLSWLGWQGAHFLWVGSWAALVYGYVVRFLALPYGAVDSALSRVTPSMEHAARTLGASAWNVMRRIHLPMMRPSLMTAGLLVFVDSMKELPLTLLLRPFDSDTLSTWVWHYARDEAFAVSAPGALLIVCVGLLPVVWLSSMISGSTAKKSGWLTNKQTALRDTNAYAPA